jgi:hypothetical protein
VVLLQHLLPARPLLGADETHDERCGHTGRHSDGLGHGGSRTERIGKRQEEMRGPC